MNKTITKIDVSIIIFIAIAAVTVSTIIKTIIKNNSVKEQTTYLYTITAPNLGTWQTTNEIYMGGVPKYVKFSIDEQEITITYPYVITKEIYAPTNFIADDE